MAIFLKDGSPAEVQVLQDWVLWAQPGLCNRNGLSGGKNTQSANLKRLLCQGLLGGAAGQGKLSVLCCSNFL